MKTQYNKNKAIGSGIFLNSENVQRVVYKELSIEEIAAFLKEIGVPDDIITSYLKEE